MIVKYAPMVNSAECENLYIDKFLEPLKNNLDDSYNFIIARLNQPNDIAQFKNTIVEGKKNILILKSDEAGRIPPFMDKLFLVFRFYNKKNLYDDNKIFSLPCGYSSDFGYQYNTSHYDGDIEKPPLIEREYDIFFSGQALTPNRKNMKLYADKLSSKFNSILNYTEGFARGFLLEEYYKKMSNSKICLVPDGSVIPESFRYFEAFEVYSTVITTYPIRNDMFNHWYYNESPAVFLNDWSQLTEELITSLLTKEKLVENFEKSKLYFDKYISPNSISKYILEKIMDKNE